MDDDAWTKGAGPTAPVVTISASYGASGSVIAPQLAARLRLPFIDRVISADLSDEADSQIAGGAGDDTRSGRSREGLSGGEQAASPGSRLFAYLARAASVGTITAPPMDVDTDEDLRHRAEMGLAEVRAGHGAVILGRAGAVVLARRPRAFHVRLDGPPARRVARAARLEGISEERAADRRAHTDRARELWVKRLYRADATDPKWYHLWIDATVLPPADVVELIEMAFARYLAAAEGPGNEP